MTTTVLLVASMSLMLMGYLLGKAIEMMIIAYQEAIDEQLNEHMGNQTEKNAQTV